ncbi:transporter substrate-binding domain-containing protein [Amycolatopsis sp. NPDC051045]|uniref:caspase, EACC1-associated type n=1 Tax=Amycolatopsis sp. NPDC051045 TaxID=3156922 RepID=UPI003430A099
MKLLADVTRSRAVLVGTGHYRTLPRLPAVPRGTHRLATALTDPRAWGLPEPHCRVLTDPGSAATVLDAVRGAAAEASDLLVLYLAGHGFVDPDADELYLALPATETDRPWTALPYEWLRRAMRHPTVRARRKLIVLDCCYSGIALGGSLSTPGRLGDRVAISGACVLTATAETRTALAPRGEPYTAFTGELLTILTDGVPGGPDLLDVETIYHQLHARLQARNRPLPQMRSRNGGHRIPLVRNLAAPAGPSLPAPARPRGSRLVAGAAAAAALLTSADTVPPPVTVPAVNAVFACTNPAPRPSPAATDADTTAAITQARETLTAGGRLTIGILPGRPGHTERCPDGRWRGFDVAIGEIIASDLGFTPERITWAPLAAVDRLTAVQNRRVDFVAGSMAITATRKQQVSFAGPYERSAQTLLVPAGDTTINSPEDLHTGEPTVCAIKNSTGADGLTPYITASAQITTRDTIDDCVRDLLRHTVQAVTGDRSLLIGYDQALAGRVRVITSSFGETAYGIAVALGDPTLRQAVHDILAHSYHDGRYARAWKDSLGRVIPEVDTGPQLTG